MQRPNVFAVTSPDTSPSVVVLGGGYGGINAAKALDDVARVTLVDPKDAFVHNVAGWRTLVDVEWADRIFLPYDRLLHKGSFVHDRATTIDGPRVTLASGDVLEPDYLIVATGSWYPFPAKVDVADTATAREHLRTAHEVLLGAPRVLVIGAGPAGLELAGEIKAFFPDKHVTVADVADDILTGPFDQDVRDEIRRQLDEMGVELVLGSALESLPDAEAATAASISVRTAAGRELTADVWYQAFGVTPQADLVPDGWRDERGYVRVDEHLRVLGQERVFAIGDVADAGRDMAGIAGREAQLVSGNVKALIAGEAMATWEVPPPAIIIPLGPDGGAGQLPGRGVVGAEAAAEMKGRTMLLDRYAEMFDAPAG
jgi:NADH dehydrogenase FAD-containing subunit